MNNKNSQYHDECNGMAPYGGPALARPCPYVYQKYAFFKNKVHVFFNYTIFEGTDMLPNRSAPVDQNLRSDSTKCKLSVGIFIAPRTHLGAQKS